jgi:hypothetical protein
VCYSRTHRPLPSSRRRLVIKLKKAEVGSEWTALEGKKKGSGAGPAGSTDKKWKEFETPSPHPQPQPPSKTEPATTSTSITAIATAVEEVTAAAGGGRGVWSLQQQPYLQETYSAELPFDSKPGDQLRVNVPLTEPGEPLFTDGNMKAVVSCIVPASVKPGESFNVTVTQHSASAWCNVIMSRSEVVTALLTFSFFFFFRCIHSLTTVTSFSSRGNISEAAICTAGHW